MQQFLLIVENKVSTIRIFKGKKFSPDFQLADMRLEYNFLLAFKHHR